jgi:hypothetical protein
VRALTRCVQFDVAQPQGEGVLAVRRKLAPLNRRQIVRLTPALQAKHEEWQQGQLKIPKVEQLRRRSRQLALSLLELGEDVEATERQLQRWQFHPALAYESSRWAWARHKDALAAAEAPEQLRLPAPSIAPAVVAAAAALSRIEGAA